MGSSIQKFTFILCLAFAAACQPVEDQQEAVSNGMVLQGSDEGKAYTIATGNEDELFMEVIDAFNTMDAEALWTHSADTITFHMVDGAVAPLTKSDMAGMFSSMDSVQWDVHSVIPVQIEGNSRVYILTEGTESFFPKNGPADRHKLFERFVFEDQKIVEIHQWQATMPGEGSAK